MEKSLEVVHQNTVLSIFQPPVSPFYSNLFNYQFWKYPPTPTPNLFPHTRLFGTMVHNKGFSFNIVKVSKTDFKDHLQTTTCEQVSETGVSKKKRNNISNTVSYTAPYQRQNPKTKLTSMHHHLFIICQIRRASKHIPKYFSELSSSFVSISATMEQYKAKIIFIVYFGYWIFLCG